MKRIIVLLKKDLKDYWIIPVLIIAFVLFIYFLPTLFSLTQSKTTLGVYGEELPGLANVNANIEIKEYGSEESAMDALRRGEVDCLYARGTLYGTRSNENELRYLATLLSSDPCAAQEPEIKIKDVEINSLPPGFTLLPILLPLAMLLGSFIGALALIGDERDKQIMDAIMLTPITYREYVLEKAILVFATTLIVPIFLLFLTGGFRGVEIILLVRIILILLLQSAFFTLLFLSITFAFPSVESAAAVSMPILILTPMLDLSSKIPSMGSMLYRVMVLEESASMDIIVLLMLVVLLFFVCTAIVRKGFKKR